MPLLLFPSGGGGSALANFLDGSAGGGLIGDVANLSTGGNFSLAFGSQAITNLPSEMAQADGMFAVPGDRQTRRINLFAESVDDATPILIQTSGPGNLFVEAFTSLLYRVYVVARAVGGALNGESMAWKLEGLCYKNTLNGTGPAILVPGAGSVVEMSDPTLPWNVSMQVGGTNSEFLQLLGEPDAVSTVRFMAKMEIVSLSGGA